MRIIDLEKATAEEMAKPPQEQLRILRKYLGNEKVDEWVRNWAGTDPDKDADTGIDTDG